MSDENERSVASDGSVANYPEIPDSCTLTKAEREVLEIAASWFERESTKDEYAGGNAPVAWRHASDARTIRLLLQRMK